MTDHEFNEKYTESDNIDAEACRKYILTRQNPDGGFCFYRSWGVNESNAPDTLAAVNSLRLLGEPAPQGSQVIAWVQSQQGADGRYATLTIAWACLNALWLLEAEPLYDPRSTIMDQGRRKENITDQAFDWSGLIRNFVRTLELMARLHLTVEAQLRRAGVRLLDRIRTADGGYGLPAASLLDTSWAVRLADLIGIPLDRKPLDYARRCKQPTYGFNITPASVSTSLEIQQGGLRLFARFGTRPTNPDAIIRFVVSCQTAFGGFSRVPGALTRLDDTWRALDILRLLKQFPDQSGEVTAPALTPRKS